MGWRVGIFGGTFDPVHVGHLRVAEEALEALDLHRIIFIPAADPPHKERQDILPFEHRWRMLALSLAGNPRFHMSDVEQKMAGKSYSVLTLQELRKNSGSREDYFFLVGLDSFLELDTWYRYRELFSLAHLVVLRRPGYKEGEVEEFLGQKVSPAYQPDAQERSFLHPSFCSVHLVDNTHLDISSTFVRGLVHRARSIRYLVADEVMSYIEDHKLYREISKDRK